MSAGLPGVGLSGVFFIASALISVPLEIVQTVRGRSSTARWATVLRHLAMSIAMIAGLALCYAGLRVALAQGSRALSGRSPLALPVLPVLATLGLVACVIGTAKGAQLISNAGRTAPGRRQR
jgi:hypothetical protein